MAIGTGIEGATWYLAEEASVAVIYESENEGRKC